ncbi:MAG: hypothetical protein ACREDD_10845 [Methylocella sp.]
MNGIAFAASTAVILYGGLAAFDYALRPGLDNCVNARAVPVAIERGVTAEARACWCALVGLPNERRLGLHLAGEPGDAALVYYEPQNGDTPVFKEKSLFFEAL